MAPIKQEIIECKNRRQGEIAESRRKIAKLESMIQDERYQIEQMLFVCGALDQMMQEQGEDGDICESCRIE